MDAPPLLKDTLHDKILQHLEFEGISEECLQGLRKELGVERTRFFEESELFKIYRYALQCFLTLQVKMFTGQVLNLDVLSTTTVGEVKYKIQAETTVPAFEQKLVFGDKTMDNKKPLVMYQVTPCANTLTVVHVNSELVLSGDLGGSLDLWDYQTGECLKTFEGHENAVSAIAADRHRQLVLSGSNDDTLKLWDLANGQCLKTFEGHDDCVNTLSVDWKELRAVSGSGDRTLRLWDLRQGRCMGIFTSDGSMLSVIVNWDLMQAVSGSMDKTMRLWDLRTGFSNDDESNRVIAERDDDRYLGVIKYGDGDSNEPQPLGLNRGLLRKFEGHSGGVRSVAASWEHMQAFSGSSDHTVRFWDLKDGRCLGAFEGHSGRVTTVCADFNASRGISGATDNTIRIWNLLTGECTKILFGHSKWVSEIAVDWGMQRVVSGSSDGKVKLWDLGSGACVETYEGSGQAVLSIAHLPNTKYMIAYVDDKSLPYEPEKKKIKRLEGNFC
eukprot:gnl/MRDRNA2_/MRDRNA2_78696_c0_seq1.p1 gnl/MRDRNA2_/MRDRNA2_78696_c0~~gnl/MRDRNA2_/MRDRNA2_78696_c0_seq1.p1  ORF type:complete len:521 (+),score=86.41 gnl/MRDRNA2_/MRDRNA2_78696_c0_seq1:71-1564(+)